MGRVVGATCTTLLVRTKLPGPMREVAKDRRGYCMQSSGSWHILAWLVHMAIYINVCKCGEDISLMYRNLEYCIDIKLTC